MLHGITPEDARMLRTGLIALMDWALNELGRVINDLF